MALYTPFVTKSVQSLGEGNRRRNEGKLISKAYMGDKAAMQTLMQVNPKLGMQLQRRKQQEEQNKLQGAAQQVRADRAVRGENRQIENQARQVRNDQRVATNQQATQTRQQNTENRAVKKADRDVLMENQELITGIYKEAGELGSYPEAKDFIQRKFARYKNILGDIGTDGYTEQAYEQSKTILAKLKKQSGKTVSKEGTPNQKQKVLNNLLSKAVMLDSFSEADDFIFDGLKRNKDFFGEDSLKDFTFSDSMYKQLKATNNTKGKAIQNRFDERQKDRQKLLKFKYTKLELKETTALRKESDKDISSLKTMDKNIDKVLLGLRTNNDLGRKMVQSGLASLSATKVRALAELEKFKNYGTLIERGSASILGFFTGRMPDAQKKMALDIALSFRNDITGPGIEASKGFYRGLAKKSGFDLHSVARYTSAEDVKRDLDADLIDEKTAISIINEIGL